MGVKRRIFIMLALFLLCLPLPIQAKELDVLTISRASLYLPEITVELTGKLEGISKEQVKAMLGERTLTTQEVIPYDSRTHSSCIYLLLDISTSMEEYFEEIREGLLEYSQSLPQEDSMVLITFGEQVSTVLSGGEDAARREEVIRSLQCNEESTVLFEALNAAYDISRASKSPFSREYVQIISDGFDFQKGQHTLDEAVAKFQDHVLPVYALCTGNATQDAADHLGTLARASGGAMVMMEAGQVTESMQQLHQQIDQVWMVRLQAQTNIISGTEELLILQVGEQKTQQKVKVDRFIPDEIPPQLFLAEVSNDNRSISLSFSERMLDADKKENYQITDEKGQAVEVKSAVYEGDSQRAVLHLEKALGQGVYKLTLFGITDESQERNPLVNKEMEISSDIVPKASEEQGEKEGVHEQMIWIWLLIAAGAVIITGAAITAAVMQRNKAFERTDRGIQNSPVHIHHEEAARLPVAQEHYHVKTPDGEKIRLFIRLSNGSTQEIKLNAFSSSVIVGRDELCDICIDDPNLSRQHFAFEEADGRIIAFDLDSTNGTKLNGIPLKGRQVLHNQDKIFAGGTRITFTIEC